MSRVGKFGRLIVTASDGGSLLRSVPPVQCRRSVPSLSYVSQCGRSVTSLSAAAQYRHSVSLHSGAAQWALGYRQKVTGFNSLPS